MMENSEGCGPAFACRSISADHKDLIHDVEYDFYGKRLATCSSDQSVKVWDLGEDEIWRCTASWKTHSGTVCKVTWAHPVFGSVLATCSFDRTVAIWEELTVADAGAGERNKSSWVKRTSLVDSRTSVTDVKFAPHHLGLLLATCSVDGIVRIYEAPDVMLLSQWSPQHELNCQMPLSSISWNPLRGHPPMIVVGSNDAASTKSGKVILFEFNENARRWNKLDVISSVTDPVNDVAFAPNLGRTYHLLAVASNDLKVFSIRPIATNKGQADPNTSASSQQAIGGQVTTALKSANDIQAVMQSSEHDGVVWRVSWNITGTTLASSGDDGFVRLWKGKMLLENYKCEP
jgi:nucleoporin SEH1